MVSVKDEASVLPRDRIRPPSRQQRLDRQRCRPAHGYVAFFPAAYLPIAILAHAEHGRQSGLGEAERTSGNFHFRRRHPTFFHVNFSEWASRITPDFSQWYADIMSGLQFLFPRGGARNPFL